MNASANQAWPPLPFGPWQATCATLHMWTQIVGKTRLALAPMQNHWWQVTLYLTPRGLTTSPIPFGDQAFAVDFDFVAHELTLQAKYRGRDASCRSPRSRSGLLQQLHGRRARPRSRT